MTWNDYGSIDFGSFSINMYAFEQNSADAYNFDTFKSRSVRKCTRLGPEVYASVRVWGPEVYASVRVLGPKSTQVYVYSVLAHILIWHFQNQQVLYKK